MNEEQKGARAWAMFMAILLGLIAVLRYRHTADWAEAIQPSLVVLAFGLLLKLFVDLGALLFRGRRFDVWSLLTLASAVSCLVLLWALGGTVKALVPLAVLSLGAAAVGIVAVWFREKVERRE